MTVKVVGGPKWSFTSHCQRHRLESRVVLFSRKCKCKYRDDCCRSLRPYLLCINEPRSPILSLSDVMASNLTDTPSVISVGETVKLTMGLLLGTAIEAESTTSVLKV